MKLDCTVSNVKVLTKRVFEGKKVNSDGSKNTYYVLGISNDRELGEVGCSLEVYDQVILDKHYDFHFVFETRYDKVYIRFDKASAVGSK